MLKIAVAGAVLVGSMLTGCSGSAEGRTAPPAAGSGPTAQGSPRAATAAAVCASPKPTVSWMGGSTGGLPEDVRCLPHVMDGEVPVVPPDAEAAPVEGRTMTVRVTEGTTRDEALALCRRLTELGYGTGGSHGMSILAVGGFDAGRYTSMPNRPPCEQIQ